MTTTDQADNDSLGSDTVPALVRHQLSRKRGWRKPENTVCVARPTKWGNPFLVGPERTQGEAVGAFRIWLTTEGVTAGIAERKQWMLEHLHKLRGKNLACWCKKGTPCHADVLMELANMVQLRSDRILPTHRCLCCGAMWRLNLERDTAEPDTWQLVSATAGQCCDNTLMGEQLLPVTETDMRAYLANNSITGGEAVP